MGPVKEITSPVESDEADELDYFFDILETFFNRLSAENSQDSRQQLSLICRSPEAGISRALYKQRHKLTETNTTLRIIFAQLGPINLFSDWLNPESSPCGENPEAMIRWARSPSLMDAHEQLTLNDECSWSGESMRREVSARFGFYMFNEKCRQSAVIARRSFETIWKIAHPIPQAQVKRARLLNESEYASVHSDTAGITLHPAEHLSPEFTRH